MQNTIDFIPDDEDTGWGVLAVRFDWPNTDKPVITRMWYPIGRMAMSRCKEWIGKQVEEEGNGLYSLFEKGRYVPTRFRLQNGGATTPCKSENVDVPPPKTKVEVRWAYGGYWEKYLKTKGWVRA
jgi:hypothetical protein